MKLEALKTAPKGERTSPFRSAPSAVERDGGMFGAGLIRRVSAITRGEALGHSRWIDSEMVGQVAGALDSAGESGTKVRFTHPGLSSDGMGKLLGRAVTGDSDGERAFTDIHIVESARSTPDGDLGGHVMDLAEESPDLFGTSIVFERDVEAEKKFHEEHGAFEDQDPMFGRFMNFSEFQSPDPANTDNLPHVRLHTLRAVDAVDEPAANPAGLFSRDFDQLQQFEAVLAYVLGKGGEPDTSSWLPVHPERLKAFFSRYLAREGLSITEKLDDALSDKVKTNPSKAVLYRF